MTLPNPDEPLRPFTENGKTYIPLPSKDEAQQVIHRTRKRLAELPALPERSNVISAVIAYELFGLDPTDIAVALSISIQQINSIKLTEPYRAIRDQIVQNITEAGASEVTEVFKEYRVKAAKRVIDLMENGRPNVSLAASKIVIEGSGVSLSPAHKQMDPMKQGLTIVYLGEEKEPDA